MHAAVPAPWHSPLADALADPALAALQAWIASEEAAGKTVFPPREVRMKALEMTPPDAVRVVILGQDPYHGPGQAMGLAFAVPDAAPLPPSLRNIFRELADDIGCPPPAGGDLGGWAQQGVLLLNTSLTVEGGKAGSHARRGWEGLTDAVVAAVAGGTAPVVFVLWGAHAQGKTAVIDRAGGGRHTVLASPHPSPLSAYRGFFGSRPFSRANAALAAAGRGAIDWCRTAAR